MAKIARITNLTRIKTQKKGPRNVGKYRKNRKYNKDFSSQLKTPMANIAKIAGITNLTRIKTQKKKGAKKDPEMSANIAKITNITKIFLAS